MNITPNSSNIDNGCSWLVWSYFAWEDIKKPHVPEKACFQFKRVLTNHEEFIIYIPNEIDLPFQKYICRKYIARNLESQKNMCPQCRQPLK